MKSFLRRAAPILLILAILIGITGCGSQFDCWFTANPAYESFAAKLADSSKPAGTANANLYFDNTRSMFGYLAEGSGNASNFKLVCDDLLDVFKGYKNYTVNALVPDKSNILRWTDVGTAGFKIQNKDFYTFKGNFNRPSETGPLQSLFVKEGSVVNFEDLNVFITDLAEQEVNNKVLAEKINEVVLGADDHSVALYCVKSYFSGEAFVPQSGVTSDSKTPMFFEEKFTGYRPFYILVVGPTIEVNSLCDEFDSAFKTTGLTEGKDYNSFKVLSKRGLKYSPVTKAEYECFNNFKIPDDDDTYYEEYPSIDYNSSNLNYNLFSVKSDEIFHADDEMDGLYYIYDNVSGYGSMDKSTFGKGTLSFVVPVSDLSDGTKALDVDYSLAYRDDEKYGNIPNVVVEGGKLFDAGTDEEGNNLSEFKWEEISYNDLFKGSNPYMEIPTVKYCKPGEKIQLVKEYTEEMQDEELPASELNLYTVDEGGSGALYVTVKFNDITALKDTLGYELIRVRFSANASRKYENKMPSWISEYNIPESATVNNTNKKTFFEKTTGLEVFYQYLTGTMGSAAERKNYESKMVKDATDVYIVVMLTDHSCKQHP